MLRIDYIREFVKLAETMSFSRTSEALYITQPTLSRHILLLEKQLGVRLVERSTRNVALTPAGAALVRDCVELLNADRALAEHAKALSGGYHSRLRICTPLYWDSAFIEPIILRFSERCPGVEVELIICDPIEGMKHLMQGNADISTGFPIQAREELDGLQFAEERLSVVMPAAHRLAGRTRVALGELLAERILLLDMDESRDVKQTAVYRLLIRHGVDPSHILFSQSPSTVGLTICKTGAVSILMHSMGNLRRDYLVAVPLSDEDCALPLFLYRRKDDPNEAVTAFFSAVP